MCCVCSAFFRTVWSPEQRRGHHQDDDDIDGVEEGSDNELDADNIVEGKRGDPKAPKPKKEKKQNPKEGAEGEMDDFLDDADMDDNMKSVVQEYNDEGDPEPMGDEAEEVSFARASLH